MAELQPERSEHSVPQVVIATHNELSCRRAVGRSASLSKPMSQPTGPLKMRCGPQAAVMAALQLPRAHPNIALAQVIRHVTRNSNPAFVLHQLAESTR